MIRRLFTLLSALSLLLCMGMAALWVRGHFAAESVAAFHRIETYHSDRSPFDGGDISRQLAMQWSAGQIDVMWGTALLEPGKPWRFTHSRGKPWADDNGTSVWNRLGFYGWYDGPRGNCAFDVPIWFAFSAFAILPTARCVTQFLRRRTGSRGGCPACGYDLRATPERCPECGAMPAAKVAP